MRWLDWPGGKEIINAETHQLAVVFRCREEADAGQAVGDGVSIFQVSVSNDIVAGGVF
jgi:hypothetical protein